MKVSLFVTCLVDMFFPEVGESTVRLLRRLGVKVDFPGGQICCSQPAWSAGHPHDARPVAGALMRALAGTEHVVTPSGSCAAMIRKEYSRLFPQGHPLRGKALALSSRIHELSEFLVRVLGVRDIGAVHHGPVACHRSCHMLRGLGLTEEPEILLQHVRGLELLEWPEAVDCCGFGGTFAATMPEISTAMADIKLRALLEANRPVTLVGADAGCLMQLGGRLSRLGASAQVMHLATFLDQATGGRGTAAPCSARTAVDGLAATGPAGGPTAASGSEAAAGTGTRPGREGD